jgi:outer membrane protein TolC
MSTACRPTQLPVAPSRRLTRAGALLSLVAAALVWAPAHARCLDEESLDAWTAQRDAPAASALPAPDPRTTLLDMVREAIERSHAVGAAALLAEAAQFDIEESRAARAPQASLNAGVGPGAQNSLGVTETSALQLRASVSVSQLLWDGGRSDRLVDWRGQLAESARLGLLNQREQLALNTVALALERSRWRQQVVVYGQYQRKMACLVQALEGIVRTDRGRASELVLARKNQQQAELAQAQAQAQVRQTEVRLRRLLGDGLPPVAGLSSVLLQVPPLEALLAEVDQATEIAQIAAQESAARRYAAAVAAGASPQVSWSFSGSAQAGTGTGGSAAGADNRPRNPRGGNLALGVNVNIPLWNPGVAPASNAAAKRAEALALQRLEALETRRFRAAELHEHVLAHMDRARRFGEVLRDSDQVRNFTLQQWQQLGRRSLFDVMGAEAEHYNLRVSYINALHDGQQLNASLMALGRGVAEWLR